MTLHHPLIPKSTKYLSTYLLRDDPVQLFPPYRNGALSYRQCRLSPGTEGSRRRERYDHHSPRDHAKAPPRNDRLNPKRTQYVQFFH